MKKPASSDSVARKRPSKEGKKTTGKKSVAPPAAKGAARQSFIQLGPSPTQSTQSISARLVASGAPPVVATVIYVHGIGNKPIASVLKCQWDQALFGGPMGDRTRLAYWVSRDLYPVPDASTCADGDLVTNKADASDRVSMVNALAENVESQHLHAVIEQVAQTGEQRDTLRRIADRMRARADQLVQERPQGPGTKVLPLPGFIRRHITNVLTQIFLQDVNQFLFHEDKRAAMENTLIERIRAGGGPFIIVAHSQGSMIAYNVLRRLREDECDVRLLVTIGSPLGMAEVQDVMQGWIPDHKLVVPDCVKRWINVADTLDVVALDRDLSDDFAANSRGIAIENHSGFCINPDAPFHPHSATGYLHTDAVRLPVHKTAGNAFFQLVGKAIVVRDLADQIENSSHDERHPALIQLVTGDRGNDINDAVSLADTRAAVLETIRALVAASGADIATAAIQEMKRFIAADLTRFEIESLRSLHRESKINKIWRNASKRALINQSTHTVQARPANLAYGATGQHIGWAVLDTGIRADHPHFLKHRNVVRQWDCTTSGAVVVLEPDDARFSALDRNGHGTHVAGIIAGEMTVPADVGQPEETYAGMAPAARLYGFKVLKDNGQGQDAFIIKALDTIADINDRAGELIIHGVNLSLGSAFDPSVYGCGHTPLCQELRRLWAQGVLVCLAAGNEGYAMLEADAGPVGSNMDLSIGDPANLEEAIAVGSVHKTSPHSFGISYFSSRGPTADGRGKPDLVAPGEQVLSAWHMAPQDGSTAKDLYIEMSGTSMATPHVSGILAAFLSMRREFIGYPDKTKQILLENCTDLERDPYIQGKGLPNLLKMLTNT